MTKIGATMLNVRLPQDAEAFLNQLAKDTGKSKSYYAKEAILAYLANIQKHQNWQASGEKTLDACQDSLNNEVEHIADGFEFLEEISKPSVN